MSHTKERKDKNCLNCGAEVQGRYCHICGQENLETNESFWGLITHFVYDITHFDGKFFTTLKYLLLRPGFLSKEFQRGKRASYLHPIKMYVFTSAVFFFIFFAMRQEDDFITGVDVKAPKQRAALLQTISATSDSTWLVHLRDSLRTMDTAVVLLEELKLIDTDTALPDSVRQSIKPYIADSLSKRTNVVIWGGLPGTTQLYDSLQQALPQENRDGWFKHYAKTKAIQLNIKYKYDRGKLVKTAINKFLHSLPQMMFLSLPFLAMFISLLYIRQKKTNYVHHGILVVHGYIAMYVLILLFMFAKFVQDQTHWALAGFVMFALGCYMLYYNYKSLRNYFEQSRGKTMIKFVILVILTLVLFALLSMVFVINSLLAA